MSDLLPPLPQIITTLESTDPAHWWPGPTYRSPDGTQHCILSWMDHLYGPGALDEFEEKYSTVYHIGPINDGTSGTYTQGHPKDRVLAFLHALQEGSELTTHQSMDAQYMATTTIYIAGPMTGYPAFNYPAFVAAGEGLKERGFAAVLNPTDVDGGVAGSKPWEWYMRECLKMLLQSDAVALLPGWEESRGASIESQLAHDLNMVVQPLDQWLS